MKSIRQFFKLSDDDYSDQLKAIAVSVRVQRSLLLGALEKTKDVLSTAFTGQPHAVFIRGSASNGLGIDYREYAADLDLDVVLSLEKKPVDFGEFVKFVEEVRFALAAALEGTDIKMVVLKERFFTLRVPVGERTVEVDVFPKFESNNNAFGWSSPAIGDLKTPDSYPIADGVSELASSAEDPSNYPALTDKQAALIIAKLYNKANTMGFKSYHIAEVSKLAKGSDIYNQILGIFDELNKLSDWNINGLRAVVFYGDKVPTFDIRTVRG